MSKILGNTGLEGKVGLLQDEHYNHSDLRLSVEQGVIEQKWDSAYGELR